MVEFRVRFNTDIFDSLNSIAQYITADSPQNAEEVADAIVEIISSLAISPARFRRVGKSRRSGAPVHMASTHSFNIYYRIDHADQTVVVLDLRRGTRRQPRRFD